MKRAGVLLFGLLLGFSLRAQQQTQQQQQQAALPEEQQVFFYEAINFIADDSTTSRVDIPYRIDQQFFIAVKNTDPSLPYQFKRRGEVLVELLDENGVSKARDIHRFEFGDNNGEAKSEDKSWHEGLVSFAVPPGEYTIVLEIDDLESERKFLDRNRKIVAKKFDGFTVETSTPVFMQATSAESPELLVPINYGGNLAFGKGASIFLQLHSKDLSTEPVRVEYSIATQNFLYQEPKVVLADTIAQLPLIHKYSPTVKPESATPVYTLTTAQPSTHTAAVIIPLKAETLPLRPFTLSVKIRQGALEAAIQQPFRMVWPEMPMSLRDIDFALEALRHITREDELDSLKSGSRDSRLTHLEKFWKKKDRTPNTEYNEVMVEYYRRVDHAMRAFSSMRGFDGHKSDRGRIYILYGPPTKTQRSLDPSTGYQEVWIYEKQNKKFVFVDQSKSGNYTLVATQNL